MAMKREVSCKPVLSSLLLLSGVLVATGCTGDPTRGGIFWSESKAKERQAQMMQTLESREREVQSIEGKTAALRSRLSAAQAQLRRVQQAPGNGPEQDEECARLRKEISELQKQIQQSNS